MNFKSIGAYLNKNCAIVITASIPLTNQQQIKNLIAESCETNTTCPGGDNLIKATSFQHYINLGHFGFHVTLKMQSCRS